VGTGTGSHVNYGPWYATTGSGKYSNRIQYIYLSNELISSGMTYSGTITQVSINVTTFLGEKWEDIAIKIGCTALNAFPTATFVTGLTTVYSSAAQYTTTNGWNTFNITPFDWNGSSNLIVEFCARTFSNTTNPEDIQYTTQGAFRCLYLQNNCASCNICNTNPGTGTQHLNRANILFTICDGAPGTFSYSWSPATGLSSTTVQNPTGTNISAPATYTVTVTGGACAVTDSISIPTCSPLVMDDLEFTGVREGAAVKLGWRTLNEANTIAFELYHSRDGLEFERIHTRVAAGNAKGWRDYDFIHLNPVPGYNYYILKTRNAEGDESESERVEVLFRNESQFLRLYPNPAKRDEEVFIDFYSGRKGTLQATIIDVTGKQAGEALFNLETGTNVLPMNIQSLRAGTYFIRLRSEITVEVARLMIRD